MSGKIATEKELFTLGGGLEGDKPSNYDINRCVTKIRSSAFKSVTANLTTYQDLQLIPVSLFGKVVMADTIQIEIEYNDNLYNKPNVDIVLNVNGNEFHSEDTLHTYKWAYDTSFMTETNKNSNNKNISVYHIDLKRVKEILNDYEHPHIEFKIKWGKNLPLNNIIQYTVKLLAGEEVRYNQQNSLNLLTYEHFPVDIFYRKIFKIIYDSSSDSIMLLNEHETDKSAIFEYDLIIKKNANKVVNKHMITNSRLFYIFLNTYKLKKGDIITLDIRNFMIKLSMSDGTEKTIIPNFTETKVGSKIKNGCKLSVLENDISHYVAQVEILKDLPIDTDQVLFNKSDLSLANFNSEYYAFNISLISDNVHVNYYNYYKENDEYIGDANNKTQF